MRKTNTYPDFNHIKSNKPRKPEALQKCELKTGTFKLTL